MRNEDNAEKYAMKRSAKGTRNNPSVRVSSVRMLTAALALSISAFGCGGSKKSDPEPSEADASVVTDDGGISDAGEITDGGEETDGGEDPDAGFSNCASESDPDGLVCGDAHSHCDDSSGTAVCECDEGYKGKKCDRCANGYQDNDKVGTCCLEGYQDKDKDGTCALNCYYADLPCETGQVCDDFSGTAACVDSEWTVMVYLDADNNLGFDLENYSACLAMGYGDSVCNYYSSAGAMDILEMMEGVQSTQEAGASPAKINLIVLLDENASAPASFPLAPKGRSWVLEVKTRNFNDGSPGEELAVIALDTGTTIFEGTEADMANSQTLIDFAGWTIKHYPAKKYALVLWNHGGGWRSDGSNVLNTFMPFSLLGSHGGTGGFRGFATDDTNHPDPWAEDSVISLSNGDYSHALAEIARMTKHGKIDLVGFDACLMGMYEVAAASEGYTDYLVASPRGVPGYGWDYSTVIGELSLKPEMEARELGEIITDSYIKEYEDEQDMEVVMGVYDMSSMDALNKKLDEFGRAMLDAVMDENGDPKPGNIRVIKEISQNLPRFEYADHADLKSLADGVFNAASLPEDLRAKAKALSDQIDVTLVAFGQSKLPDDHGMGIFFPISFNCCIDEDHNRYTITTAEELQECPIWPYSSFICEEEGGSDYNLIDLMPPTTSSSGVDFVGDYYAAPWWKTDLEDLTSGLTGWKNFLSFYYELQFLVTDRSCTRPYGDYGKAFKEENCRFTDARDGNVYPIVAVGDQIWMGQNLRYKQEGDTGVYEVNDNAENTPHYGLLYTWDSALNACPAGWRLPRYEDFEKLMGNVANIASSDGITDFTALIAKSGRWQGIAANDKMDASGLSIEPAGFRRESNPSEPFGYQGTASYWWGFAKEPEEGKPGCDLYLDTNSGGRVILTDKKESKHMRSVRCIQE